MGDRPGPGGRERRRARSVAGPAPPRSRERKGHGRRGALTCASAERVPFRDASFDLVFCDHGAMSFCDPDRTVPEAGADCSAPAAVSSSTRRRSSATSPTTTIATARATAPTRLLREPRLRLRRGHRRLPDPVWRVDPAARRQRLRRRGPRRAASARRTPRPPTAGSCSSVGAPVAGGGDLGRAEGGLSLWLVRSRRLLERLCRAVRRCAMTIGTKVISTTAIATTFVLGRSRGRNRLS